MQLRLCRPWAGLVAVLACAAILPPSAFATGGTYTHVLCANPDTGVGVAANGKLPDGTTNPTSTPFAPLAAGYTRCSGPADATSGVGVTPGGGWSTSEPNRGEALSYRVPAPLLFTGGVLYRHGVISGRFGWTITRNGQWNQMYARPIDDHCTWGDGCSSRGSSAVPFGTANRVVVGTNATNGFDVSVLCDIPSGWTCTADDSQVVRVYGARLGLEDQTAPMAGAAVGSLASSSVLSGPAGLDFSASDTGSGVYRVRVLLDGVSRINRVVHDHGGRCADVNPANSDDYEFAFQVPCRTSVSVRESFDTTSLPEGPASLRVVVEDAGGNTATVVDRSVTVDNVPPPLVVSDPSVEGLARRGSGLAVVAGSWDDHGLDGEPSVGHQWQRCARDGTSCVDVAGAHGMTFVLGPDDVGRRMRVVETASNSEGSTQAVSLLTEVVTLEDGSLPPDRDGIDNDGDGQVDEPGETGGSGSGSGSGSGGHTDNPSGLSGSRLGSSSSSSSGAGAPSPTGVNGEGASPRARLTVTYAGRGGTSRTVPFVRSASAVGLLVDEHGRPIRNAIVDVASTPSVRGARAAAASPAVTGPDGRFTYRLPARASSRTVRFEYRYLREGDVVSEASLVLRVRAAVRLAVRLRGVAVRYSGRVLSRPLPRAGKLVVLQGRVRGGRWQTFATRRASRQGTFRGRYRLKVRRPGVRLQFRARAVAESGWPYLDGTSRTVTRRVK